jgi:TonB family protein
MAPITKEPETLSSAQSSTGTIPPAGAKSQPTAAEILVTVNGARSVQGTDRREPFSEKTQTVLVFANGGVIRLSSPVSSGQLLFLTNEKSRKEVVCQVVKSKNYSSVSGYVELEFTEASPGFWGMRFPSSEGAASVSTLAKPAVTIPAPALKPVEEATAKTNTTKPPAPVSANTIPSLVTESAPHRAARLPQQSAIPAGRLTESKPAPAANGQPVPALAKIPTLSEFLTHGESGPALKGPERVKPVAHNVRQAQAKQDETTQAIAQASKIAVPAKTARDEEKKESLTSLLVPAPVRENPAPGTSTFDFAADEIKIPAWLEPLARNSSITSAPPETKIPATHEWDAKAPESNSVLAEPAETLTSSSDLNEHPKTGSLSPAAAAQDSDSDQQAVFTLPGDGPAPNFSSSLALDAGSGEGEGSSRGAGAGLKLGLLAATVVLAAGGGWYWYSNQPKDVSENGRASAANQFVAPAAASTEAMGSPAKSGSPASAPGGEANRNALNSQTLRSENREVESPAAAFSKPAANEHNFEQPVVAPSHSIEAAAKKPSIGKVHLAAPVVNRQSTSDNGADAAPVLNGEGVMGSESARENLLSRNAKQPSAPTALLQAGGDVKTATLLSSVAPIYPQMARTQRVSGDVKIEAFIGADGRVSTMKVISGPALLHQSALDAVRQWKYKAATLNGQPVAMHLMVTVQFRLQ